MDAAGITRVLKRAWTVKEETRYLESLLPCEAIHVGLDDSEKIIGMQTLDCSSLSSTSHVGQIGLFLLPEWRGPGVGRSLWKSTEFFARQAGYRKFAIQDHATNAAAQAFYLALGFKEGGPLSRQVIIDGVEDDEVIMEYLF